MSYSPAGLSLADANVQLLDANGDGRAELQVTREGLAGYFSLTFTGSLDTRSFQRATRRARPGRRPSATRRGSRATRWR